MSRKRLVGGMAVNLTPARYGSSSLSRLRYAVPPVGCVALRRPARVGGGAAQRRHGRPHRRGTCIDGRIGQTFSRPRSRVAYTAWFASWRGRDVMRKWRHQAHPKTPTACHLTQTTVRVRAPGSPARELLEDAVDGLRDGVKRGPERVVAPLPHRAERLHGRLGSLARGAQRLVLFALALLQSPVQVSGLPGLQGGPLVTALLPRRGRRPGQARSGRAGLPALESGWRALTASNCSTALRLGAARASSPARASSSPRSSVSSASCAPGWG